MMDIFQIKNDLTSLSARFAGPPVNIEGIIKGLGLELDKRAQLNPDIAGQLEHLGNGHFKISANQSDHYYRQRFTMAHELAHFLLHQDRIGDGVDDNRAYRSVEAGRYYNRAIGPHQEAEANKLAAQLLMPAASVKREFDENSSIRTLASRFQVSEQAMRIRLQGIGLIDREEGAYGY